MALNAVLVDRARRVARTPTGQRVDGTTVTTAVRGPWFRCRLQLSGAPEVPGPEGVAVRTTPSPTLLYRPVHPDGTLVGLSADDRVEIASAELGEATYRVAGDPEPLRKKRRVLAFQASLERVDEHPMRRGGL